MLEITFLAVAKVIVAVCIGAMTCNSVPYSATSIKDFSFTISNVILPCLSLSNIARSINVDMFIRSSVLVFLQIFFLFGMTVSGIVLAKVFMRPSSKENTGVPASLKDNVRLELCYNDLTEEELLVKSKKKEKGSPYVAVVIKDELYNQGITGDEILPLLEIPSIPLEEFPGHICGSIIGLTFQNIITLPLSLLQSVAESVDWIDVTAATAYIFIFSIPSTLYLWSVGPLFVERAKKQGNKLAAIRKLMLLHEKRSNQCDVQTQTEVHIDSVASPYRKNVSVFPAASKAKKEDSNPLGTATTVELVHEGSVPVPGNEGLTRTASQVDMEPNRIVGMTLDPTPASSTQFPYDWREEGIIRVISESQFKDKKTESKSMKEILISVKDLLITLLHNVPLMAIVTGLIIGVTPFLHDLFFDGGPLSMLMDTIAVMAEACIPCSLLLLGANLMGSTKAPTDEDTTLKRNLEQNTDFPIYEADLQIMGEDVALAYTYNQQHASIELNEYEEYSNKMDNDPPEESKETWMTGVEQALSLKGLNKKFIWGIIGARLVVVPGICFLMIVYLCKYMPFLFGDPGEEDKTMMLVLFAEIGAPSAINSALLFNQRQFMTYKWAKMLFFQYVLCSFTLVAWSWLGLSFVETL
ncbi:Membrane transport protein, putative [Angomonas deanei]|uniref:Membrane transport protein, putative n=1 Tax=Angomonas deanei TaxID=59799 RepID=A0A7G2CM96_9TRYP|nr:Membrane transport protein, putative [Angomonas deanei]